jgi:hypothetical protein
MPKKPTLQQKNLSKKDDLLKQKVSTTTGFLKQDFKQFIVDEMIHAANNKKQPIKATDSVQKRYDKFKVYYDKLFTKGLPGHGLFSQQIEKQAKRDMDKGIEYYIREKGIEKLVRINELAYKMELLSHKMATQHDVAYTKFKPVHYLIGKGQYKVVIEIPNIKEDVEDLGYDDLEEMSVEEVYEYFEEHNVEIIISDPSKLKGKDAKEKFSKAKAKRIKAIEQSKKKHYKQWKKGKKVSTQKKKPKPSTKKTQGKRKK